jgi:prevent-host-death family protein
MKTINICAAKSQFSRLVKEAAAGEEIVITKAGKPMARLVALDRNKFARIPGALKGMIRVKKNFDDPLPPELAHAFGMDE